MRKLVFDLQRFAKSANGKTGFDALELMHSIIQRFDLKTVEDTKLQDGSSTLNSTLKFIGTFFGSLFFKKSSRTSQVNALTTILAGIVSIVEDVYAIREENAKDNPSKEVIASKAENLISKLASLTNAFQKLASGKNSFILSITSAVIGLTANLVLGMDGLKDSEVEKINNSYVELVKVSGAEIIKKFFSTGLADNLIEMPTSQILNNPAVQAEIRNETAVNFTKDSGPLGLIFAAITGVLNGANKYDSNFKKYTDDGIPEKIAKHDARIDALATFIHDTASSYAKGFDDTVFKWIQAGLSFIRGKDIPYYTDKNYVEVIADWIKTLNYKNSGTSGDDKFYVLEDKSMIYGDSGNDDIGNYGFSNVTIWGGHDDDTLGSYKTDSATPQKNSIFGGPGDDQISVYDVNSTIYGGTGKDFINVVGTNNKIFGDADDDKLYIANGANNNTISVGKGNDFVVMQDGAKNTLIKYSSGDGNDTIYGFNEDDSIKISGSYKTAASGNDFLITAGEGSILLIGMAGKEVTINDKTRKRGKEDPTATPVPPPEFPTLPATVASPIIYGTESSDNINNGLNYALIQTRGLRDYITNYADFVTIDAGSGDDCIENGFASRFSGKRSNNVIINGGEGNDSIENLGDNVTIDGGTGNDTISNGASWSVSISAGDGNDSIYNGRYYIWNSKTMQWEDTGRISDNSTIDGGNGDDTIFNEIGNNVSINGGEGNDEIHSFGLNVTINGDSGDDIIGTGSFSSYNIINGDDGNDSIYSWGSNSTIAGGNGNDFIYNNSGWKYGSINGGVGNDEIHNHDDFVRIDGGDGDDRIWNEVSGTPSGGLGVYIDAGAGNDTLYNDGDDSTLIGGNGEDYIENWNANVFVDAGAGNDIIINNSSGNNSTIFSGTGNDYIDNRYTQNTLFKYISGDGNDIIKGFNSTSTLQIGNGTDTYFSQTSGEDIIVTVGKGKITLEGVANLSKVNIDGVYNDPTLLTITNSTKSPVTVGSAVKTIDASTRTKAVKITGNSKANTISGGSKADTLYGGSGNDSIVGNAGNDKLFGEANADTLSGGAGKDTLSGGADNDILYGETGNDCISGGKGNDTLIGGKGNDSLWGDAGADKFIYETGDGKDIIYGFDNKDTLTLDGIDFKTSYSKSKGTITFKVDGGSVTLKDFSAKIFHINDDTYKISGSTLKKQ